MYGGADSVVVWALCQPARGRRPSGGGFKAGLLEQATDRRQFSVFRRHSDPAASWHRRSEGVGLAIVVGRGGCQRRGTGRQAQAVQDSYCGGGRTNCSQDFHSSAAMFTLKNVHQEDTFHQLRPGIVAIAHRRLRAGLRLNRRHGGLLGRRLRFHFGVPAILIPVWNDQGSPGGSRAQYSVISGQVSARRRHQDRQFGDEVLTLENDRDGSVTPWTFRT